MQSKPNILIIDDEQDIRMLIAGILEDEGYAVFEAANSTQAYETFHQVKPDLVILDIWLQGSDEDGMEILGGLLQEQKDLPVLMISGHGTIETAVSAIKIGAYDFIEKPFKSDRLLLMIDRALENANLKKQNEDLKQRTTEHISSLAKQIPQQIKQVLDKAAKSNSRIFITGEVGTGKGICAKFLHQRSDRANQPFMTLNCANPDTDHLEIELFGKTGIPGKEPSQKGILSLANGGTLLLDEVTALPIALQGKLLSALQNGYFHPVGGNERIPFDVRVISTTSAPSTSVISNPKFREDLYYRLNVVPIAIPPLRERKNDIPALIESACKLKFSSKAISRMQTYSWPGNIKQLHNVLEWVNIMLPADKDDVTPEDLPPELGGNNTSQNIPDIASPDFAQEVMDMQLREARECFERFYLLNQVNKFDGNISKTAEFIGMERSALHRKLKLLDVFSDDKQNVA